MVECELFGGLVEVWPNLGISGVTLGSMDGRILVLTLLIAKEIEELVLKFKHTASDDRLVMGTDR